MPLRYGSQDYPRILGVSVPIETPYWFGLHPVQEHTITSMRLVWPDEQPAFMRHAVNAPTRFDDEVIDELSAAGVPTPQALAASDRQIYADSRAELRRRSFRVIAGGRD